MDWWYFFLSIYFVSVTADIRRVLTLSVQQDELIRLECTVTSKQDAEGAMWMRIRPPHNPDILTYRDSVVYAPDRIELEQRRLSSDMYGNGTLTDTYYLTLTILRPTIDDEGRYICSKRQKIFAEYDLFIIIPPQFIDDNNFKQQRSIIEGSTLHLSCSVYGRPQPSITWFYRTHNDKHIFLSDGEGCLDKKCEIHLLNFTRDDPDIVECIADNQKSSRISKVFMIDVLYPPKIITNVRTLLSSKNTEIFLECLSLANPSPTTIWLDDDRSEIHTDHLYTIKQENQSSILSFSTAEIHPSKVIYYCQSHNSIGSMEKFINISKFLGNDPTTTTTTTTTLSITSTSLKSTRARPRSTATSVIVPITTTPLNHCVSCYSTKVFLIFILCNFFKNTIYCTV